MNFHLSIHSKPAWIKQWFGVLLSFDRTVFQHWKQLLNRTKKVFLNRQNRFLFNICLTNASSFLLLQMRPYLSFERQTYFFEWITNSWQKLMVWGCCFNWFNSGQLVISMIFRLTNSRNSVGKNFLWFKTSGGKVILMKP